MTLVWTALSSMVHETNRVTPGVNNCSPIRRLAGSKLSRLPGLTELLKWIDDKGIRKVAVTNAPRLNAELMLTALDLEGYFEHLVIGTECSRAKPFPDPYLEGMRLVGAADAAVCVAFEDSPTGLGAAVAAGIPTAGALYKL
jgi:HAD superfamily hydrolase (TIGR01509 family)